MDIKEVFLGLVVVFVSIFAILSFINENNEAYNMDVGSTFNNSLSRVKTLSNVTQIGNRVANNTQFAQGAGEEDQDQSLLRQAQGSFTLTTKMLGLVPDIMTDGARMLRIPQEYTNIAVSAFLFVFGLTLAFILLLGVRRLVG